MRRYISVNIEFETGVWSDGEREGKDRRIYNCRARKQRTRAESETNKNKNKDTGRRNANQKSRAESMVSCKWTERWMDAIVWYDMINDMEYTCGLSNYDGRLRKAEE